MVATNLSNWPAYIVLVRSGSDGIRQFVFRVWGGAENPKRQPSIGIALPNADSNAALRFRFQGQTEEFSFDAMLWPSETDLSDSGSGSTAPGADFPSGVSTVKDQIRYLRDYMFTAEFDTVWSITENAIFSHNSRECTVELMNIQKMEGTPDLATCNVKVAFGNLAGI